MKSLPLLLLLLPLGLPAQERILGIDFNTDSAPREPTQPGFHVMRGKQDGDNGVSLSTSADGVSVTVSKKPGAPFNFRGANARKDRAIPRGDTTLAHLVADLVFVQDGEITLAIEGLPAGSYTFVGYHLEPYNNRDNLGFARGASDTKPQTLVALMGGEEKDRVVATALSPAGLGTDRITDRDIPKTSFVFHTDGAKPVIITLRGTETYRGAHAGHDKSVFVLLNGFEIRGLLP